MRNILLIFVLILGFQDEGFAEEYPSENSIKLIIDTDCDEDDIMAIMYLSHTKNVKIEAITTTGTGMDHWKYTAPNILKVLEVTGRPTIPVSYGAKVALSPYASFPESWRKEMDRVYGIPLPKNPNPPVKMPSDEMMINIIKNSKDKITLLCLGPLTNLAMALHKDPSIKDNIERVYISGGAVNHAGNVIGKHHGYKIKFSEYNVFLDALAARDVILSGIPITLCALNGTEDLPVTKQVVDQMSKQTQTPSAKLAYQICQKVLESERGFFLYFWDPGAAVVMTHPEVGTYKMVQISVDLEEGPYWGETFETSKGKWVDLVTSIDEKEFMKFFLGNLNAEEDLQQRERSRAQR